MRHLPVLLYAILLIGMPAWAEDEAPKPQLPPLDFIVTTKLNTTKEHMAAYARYIETQLLAHFPALIRFARNGRNEAIKDGDAQYRLLIEVTGTITLGNAITSKAVTTAINAIGSRDIIADQWLRAFYISVQQQTTANYKFLKWEDGKYKELLKWSAPVPKSPEDEKNNGMIEIARTQGRASQQKEGDKPPMTLVQAQQVALNIAQPGSVIDAVLSKWLEVKLVKAEASKDTPPEITADIVVTNKSPWLLRRVSAVFLWKNMLISAGDSARASLGLQAVEFAEPLKPGGEPAKLTVKAKALKDPFPKAGLHDAEFAQPPPPDAPPQQ